MRFTRRRAIQTIAATSTSPWWFARARAQTPATIRLAMIPIEAASLVYYAADNGYFSKAGLTVEITQNASTPATASALVSGTFDIAYAAISTLAVAHSRGLPFVMLAPGVGWIPGRFAGVIMVATSSTIKTAKDFNGKTLATAGLGTIAEYQPRAWIDKHGGDSTTVKFIELPFPLTADAMASGRVEGAYMVEPFITSALKKGVARILIPGDDAIGSRYTSTGWYSTTAWAKENPDVVTRFQAAMFEAARWANANPLKVVPILVKYLHADPTITAEANRSYFPERLIASDVQPWIDVTARYAKFPAFPAAEILYTAAK
jgi:NitT/TauT family transport system substrate-binding protein